MGERAAADCGMEGRQNGDTSRGDVALVSRVRVLIALDLRLPTGAGGNIIAEKQVVSGRDVPRVDYRIDTHRDSRCGPKCEKGFNKHG